MPLEYKTATTYWVCVDCYAVQTGTNEDWELQNIRPDREPLSRIPETATVTEGLLSEEHDEGCPNRPEWVGDECYCERREFTWAPCDGCGSTLGGSREALTVWTRED